MMSLLSGGKIMKLLRLAAVAGLSFMMLAIPAEAKRRGGGVGFIPIPTGETIVKVLDFPDTAILRREDGTYIDLGYRFSRKGDKWVGYIGSSRSYLDLNETQLKAIMSLVGIKQFPPIPKKPASAAVGGGFSSLLIGLGILVILYKLGSGFVRVLRGSARAVSATGRGLSVATQLPEQTYSSAVADRLDERIAQAAAAYNQTGMAAPLAQARAAYAPQYQAAQPSFGRAPTATFGKRV
jgi:hypothetical protein